MNNELVFEKARDLIANPRGLISLSVLADIIPGYLDFETSVHALIHHMKGRSRFIEDENNCSIFETNTMLGPVTIVVPFDCSEVPYVEW